MKLLIVEDEEGIRESLLDYFQATKFDVAAVSNLAAARAALSSEKVALIILDLLLPDGDGIELLEELREKGDDTPVIIVTARGEERQRIAGLRAGADDYVVKPFSIVELEARVHAVVRRRPSLDVLEMEDARIDLKAHTYERSDASAPLLQKEAELLKFLSQNPGVTHRRSALLRQVWGYDAAPTTRTVDTHIFKLRKKLERSPEEPRHLITVHGVGYRFDP